MFQKRPPSWYVVNRVVLYKALVQSRAEEARKKGFSYLFVDAGSMSQPILEKIGFKELTKIQGFHWSPF